MWWWLSFADGDRPLGQQWLGGAIVRADSFSEAMRQSHVLDINPGGEVKGFALGRSDEPPIDAVNRLLTADDMEQLGIGKVRF